MGPSSADPESAESREEFLGAVAHELKGPITVLRLSTQLLIRQRSRPDELDPLRHEELLKAVDRQAEKLGRLVTYLLDVSRSGTSSLPLEIQDIDLVPFVRLLIVDQQLLTKQHEIVLRAPAQLMACVDPARLEQVIFNLLDNAIKYSPEGGPITVELAQTDGSAILISVRDHGVGVPLQQRETMFDRFTVAHDRDKAGLGLGLYISRRIVDLHGGDLKAEFPEDGGTRLVISLPAALATGSGDAERPQGTDHAASA